MNINTETKLIIDIENKYLFDENDIIVILKESEDLDILREYSIKNILLEEILYPVILQSINSLKIMVLLMKLKN